MSGHAQLADALELAERLRQGGRACNGANGARAWPDPQPLGVSDVPEFPVRALPPVLRRFVEESAAAFQVSADVPALCVLGVLGIAGAHRAHVLLNPDWREELNLAVLLALESGERKSAVLDAAKAPLEDIEADEVRSKAPDIAKAVAEKRCLEAVAAKAERDLAAGKGSHQAAADAVLARDSFTIPTTPRLLADNVTAERLLTLLGEHGGRLGVVSDEGSFVANLLGRYSGEGGGLDPLEGALKAISNQAVRVDRATAGRAATVPRPALSVLVVVQPSVLEKVRARPLATERGFLPRFLFSRPRSMVGRRLVYDVPALSERARVEYAKAVRAIFSLEIRADDYGRPDSPALCLEPAARCALLDYAESIERRLAPGGELEPVRAWAAKQPGRVARIAGLLHLAANGRKALATPLTDTAASAAVAIGRYLEGHAFAAWGLAAGHELDGAAVYVLRRWIEAGSEPTSTKALFDMARTLGSAERVKAVLVHLRDAHGLVDGPQYTERPGRGRRASPLWELHPDADEFCVNCVIGARGSFNSLSFSLSQSDTTGTPPDAKSAEYAKGREPGSDDDDEAPALPAEGGLP